MAEIPIINVGRYSGTPIDKLPASYLRWMLAQDFPQEWKNIAKAKVEESPVYGEPLVISMHAIDRFSVRFIRTWQDHMMAKHSPRDGLATFLVKQAELAWKEGKDVSKNRDDDDGVIKLHKGIKYVFSKNDSTYRELITVMD